MAVKTKIGTGGNDNFSLGNFGEPGNNWQYLYDGGTAGTDTLYFDDGGGGYANRFISTGFTIGSTAGVNDHLPNAAGDIIVSGASTGGTHLTFTLKSVEKLVFWDQTITLSYTPAGDTAAPVFVAGSAVVNGTTLVMSYTDANNLNAANPPLPGAFTVSGGHAVSGVAINAAAKTVTLTLATPVVYGESVVVSYNDPTAGNDANAIQDVAGNDAVSLGATAVVNNTPVPTDTTAPVFSSASVNGLTLVMNYTDANNLDASHPPAAGSFSVSGGHGVSGVAVNASAKTVTLTLGSAVSNGEVVTVSYTDPSGANDVNAIQDAAGNDAASLGVTAVANNTPLPADSTSPVFSSAAVNGSTLVMTYTDSNNLDASNLPSTGAFTVSGAHGVSGVSVNAAAKTLTLNLLTPVSNGEVVTISYTDPSGANDVNAIQDSFGNDALSISGRAVTNNTPPGADVTVPVVTTFAPADAAIGVLIGRNIDVTFSELIQKGTGTIEIHSGSAAGTLVASYNAATSPNLSVSGSILTINPSTDLGYNTHYYVTFSAGSVKDLAGNSYAGTTTYDFTTADLALVPMTRNGVSVMPVRYTGPATAAGGDTIHFEYIGDSSNEVLIGTAYNDFINVGAGVDAVDAGAGKDVIDGGTGSNFLSGGAGTDIFFSDGRGGATTWSTITDWQAGEQLSVWGWTPGTSRIVAWQQDGAAGYQGLTMHADLNGDGTIDTSVTFTGITSQSQLPTPLEFPGVLWFT